MLPFLFIRKKDKMDYFKTIQLKNGKICCLRSGSAADAEEALSVFNQTHAETDFLLTYPEENSFTVQQESEFLAEKFSNENEIEIVAEIDGRIVGTAGFEAVGAKLKIRHRADFGISILKEYWGLGIGRALTLACIDCAREAGYAQLELNVVGENESAIRLYESCGFVEYGRNPKGFVSKVSGYQELVYMRKELEESD